MRATFSQFTKPFTYPPGNLIKYIKLPFPWAFNNFFWLRRLCLYKNEKLVQ